MNFVLFYETNILGIFSTLEKALAELISKSLNNDHWSEGLQKLKYESDFNYFPFVIQQYKLDELVNVTPISYFLKIKGSSIVWRENNDKIKMPYLSAPKGFELRQDRIILTKEWRNIESSKVYDEEVTILRSFNMFWQNRFHNI